MKHRIFLLLIAFMLPALSMRGQHDTEEQLRALTHAWNDAHTAARLVLTSITTGVISMKDIRKVGSIGWKKIGRAHV